MIALNNQQAPKDTLSLSLNADIAPAPQKELNTSLDKVKTLNTTSTLTLPGRLVTHHPKAGLNPLVDTAGYLFSVLGKLKYLKSFRQLNKLQTELVQELNTFQVTAKKYGYDADYVTVSRFVICATFDDIISNTPWGGQNRWDSYSLLAAFGQDIQHHEKFFTILERAIKEPTAYIDLMEFTYICLSMGYKGPYRITEHNQFQLEQITHNLYKHIRAYRGHFGKTLSPAAPKLTRLAPKVASQKKFSLLYIFFVTACINTIIFVSLGYLMDVISNEAYQNITQVQTPTSQ